MPSNFINVLAVNCIIVEKVGKCVLLFKIAMLEYPMSSTVLPKILS